MCLVLCTRPCSCSSVACELHNDGLLLLVGLLCFELLELPIGLEQRVVNQHVANVTTDLSELYLFWGLGLDFIACRVVLGNTWGIV